VPSRSLVPCVLAFAIGACQRSGSDGAEAPERAAPSFPAADAPTGESPGTYMGRTLAPTMTYHGAAWLTRPERQAEENTERMHAELGLRPGDVACDLGAGNGYHTLKMARAVGPSGRAIAVDIQQEMLDLLVARARDEGVTNVEIVLGGTNDPKLPPGTCDLILLVDVYHELDQPAAMLRHLRRALTPDGRIALLEFRAEDPDVPIKELHKMSKSQILLEFGANGLDLVMSYDDLPWQHMMFFSARR
jgi:ubiquinone/menaquinone biosynthesis C-methylase UbiE